MALFPGELQSAATLEAQTAGPKLSQEQVISPRGDAILIFGSLDISNSPQLRFLVSSHMLSECSPFVARIFAKSSIREPGDHDIQATKRKVLSSSGSPYRESSDRGIHEFEIQQQESNEHDALTILLHAAHMHNDMIPRDITFDQFIAIAEVCRKYQCTSPLEIFVEYKWLPHWMPRATEDMPLGFLFISYVFGLRRLFTRMSKTVIMNIRRREDFAQQCGTSSTMTWPQELVDKIWAVRSTKVDQVYACCRELLQEYLPAPTASRGRLVVNRDDISVLNKSLSTHVTEAKPTRCPRGSQACDAMNLGWLIMSFNERGLMPEFHPFADSSGQTTTGKSTSVRSLRELLDALRFMPSSPDNIHDGPVCDYQNAFRSALNDVYNSIAGLTLYDISGKEHGWSLSKQKANLPQRVFRLEKSPSPAPPSNELQPSYTSLVVRNRSYDEGKGLPSAAREIFSRRQDRILQHIFHALTDTRDIKAVAMINRAAYEVYKTFMLEIPSMRPSAGERIGRKAHRRDGSTNNNFQGHLNLSDRSTSTDPILHRRQRSSDSMTIHRINSSLSVYRSPPAPVKLDRTTATAAKAASASRDTEPVTEGGQATDVQWSHERNQQEDSFGLTGENDCAPSINIADLHNPGENKIKTRSSHSQTQSATIISPERAHVQNQQDTDWRVSDTTQVDQPTSSPSTSTTWEALPSSPTASPPKHTSTDLNGMKSIARDDHCNEKFLRADLLRVRTPEDKSLSGKDDKVARPTFEQILFTRTSNSNDGNGEE